MNKKFTCIICPNGCEMEAVIEAGQVISLEGALCKRGNAYVEQELTDPQRNISTSVLVENGEMSLVSVRLTEPIPKNQIFNVMEAIRQVKLQAPVTIGQVVIQDVLGFKSSVIATKSVRRN